MFPGSLFMPSSTVICELFRNALLDSPSFKKFGRKDVPKLVRPGGLLYKFCVGLKKSPITGFAIFLD
ncbi:hypothetical protein X777_02138 [Ooceraea biroi]|uniref:Uncharacterized protein n=1 Tax=Ooceraea biroi TaxID=2015173 RepID=A0A026WNS5_OOCBI|nr:hypothetical protein X777_02138 [Ooceraea biroi]